MKKVKVTQEQAEMIEITKNDMYHEKVIGYIARKEKIPNPHYRCLSTLSLGELLKVLYEPNSYEVESQFKVGDWVVYIHNETVWQVVRKITDGDTHHDIERLGSLKNSVHRDHIRHATPEEIKAEKERQLWKSIGREVGEFRFGDIRIVTSSPRITTQPSIAKNEYEQGELEGFYPIESLIKF